MIFSFFDEGDQTGRKVAVASDLQSESPMKLNSIDNLPIEKIQKFATEQLNSGANAQANDKPSDEEPLDRESNNYDDLHEITQIGSTEQLSIDADAQANDKSSDKTPLDYRLKQKDSTISMNTYQYISGADYFSPLHGLAYL